MNALPGVFDDLQEPQGMLMSHGSSICSIYFSGGLLGRDATTGLPAERLERLRLQWGRERLPRSQAGVADRLADFRCLLVRGRRIRRAEDSLGSPTWEKACVPWCGLCSRERGRLPRL